MDKTRVGPEPPVVVLPAGQLQNQLLSTSGIQSDSPVEVYTNYAEAQQQLSSLLPSAAVAANTTVFVPVLVAPSLEGNLTQVVSGNGSNASEEPCARTQLYYNCTSAPNIWDLLADTNIQALVNFTELNRTKSFGLLNKQNVSAVATIRVKGCNVLHNYSAVHIITGNAFFGPEFATNATSFRVVTSQVVNAGADNTNEYLVRMKLAAATKTRGAYIGPGREAMTIRPTRAAPTMARATLADLYPSCRIKFYTTDVDSIAESAAQNASGGN